MGGGESKPLQPAIDNCSVSHCLGSSHIPTVAGGGREGEGESSALPRAASGTGQGAMAEGESPAPSRSLPLHYSPLDVA